MAIGSFPGRGGLLEAPHERASGHSDFADYRPGLRLISGRAPGRAISAPPFSLSESRHDRTPRLQRDAVPAADRFSHARRLAAEGAGDSRALGKAQPLWSPA